MPRMDVTPKLLALFKQPPKHRQDVGLAFPLPEAMQGTSLRYVPPRGKCKIRKRGKGIRGDLHAADALERLAGGVSLEQIAKERGVSNAVEAALLKARMGKDAYAQAMQAGAAPRRQRRAMAEVDAEVRAKLPPKLPRRKAG